MIKPASGSSNDFARGYATALVCAVILSTTAVFIRYLTETYQLPPLVLAFWRDVFTALTLLLALRLVRPALTRAEPRHLPYLAAYGLVLALFNAIWTLSVALNGAAVSTVLVNSSAAFTAVLGCWLLREQLSPVKVMAIVLTLGGCVLVSGASSIHVWRTDGAAVLVGISAGLCYSTYSLMGRSASHRGLNPWTTVLYTFGGASLILLLLNLAAIGPAIGGATRPSDLLWLGRSVAGWGTLLLLAAGPTLVGFGLYNTSLCLLPSSTANLIMSTEPAFTAAIAFFLLGERLTGKQITGSLIILFGVALLRLRFSRLESVFAHTSDHRPAPSARPARFPETR